MDASQIAAAARATAASVRDAGTVDFVVAPEARFLAASWDRFAIEIERIDLTT